ncbi:MAG TPA: potassium transporter Kup [Gemmatimonadales bacterium]|nr:potassium transporter Kup [Gemmatimonadales bacterium]
MTAGPDRSSAGALAGTVSLPVATRFQHAEPPPPTGKRLAVLSLTALGVVYGDIGTSPLYTIGTCFGPEYGLVPNALNVYGILSLILWSLILVVAIKYLVFILQADNRGEGGVLAMLALLMQRGEDRIGGRRRRLLVLLGVFGTALLFGDGVITPAMSVLGAMEGLEVAAPELGRFVVIVTVAILFLLFMFQKMGTARVGGMFGPITLIWFLTIGTLGGMEIARAPEILAAVNPAYAVRFFLAHGFTGFAVLGAVFLAVTGAEALYADIGHFGKRPIRLAFFCLVLPCLLLNYFGQGSLLLREPAAIANPFYLLAPRSLLYPLLVISTLAAIVASQALISGAFSLAQQSVQLGYSPRLTIVHTSAREVGQIYVPEVNAALMVGTLLIVLGFRSTTALGAAYGIAVTGTMSITTLLFAVVARARWHWPLWRVMVLAGFFFSFDFAFLGANVLKIEHGGWVPLAIAAGVGVLMTTWKRGRQRLLEIVRENTIPMDLFLADVGRWKPHRVPGAAVFLTSDASGAPPVLLHHLKHNKVLHEKVMLMSIVTEGIPHVPAQDRAECRELGQGFYQVVAHYGFMETPDVPGVLQALGRPDASSRPVTMKLMETTFYLGRETLIATNSSKRASAVPPTDGAASAIGRMAVWRKKLFILMTRNARSATAFFGLPPNRVVELGAQIQF